LTLFYFVLEYEFFRHSEHCHGRLCDSKFGSGISSNYGHGRQIISWDSDWGTADSDSGIFKEGKAVRRLRCLRCDKQMAVMGEKDGSLKDLSCLFEQAK